MKSEPIVIQPFSVPKPWGGTHLNPWKQNNTQKPIGELILLSGIDNFPTLIEYNGRQQTFHDYWHQIGRKTALYYGSQCTSDIFPILLKILSTQKPLSLQVHPSTQDLKTKFNKDDIGKFESWVVLDSEASANIYLGIKDEYSEDDLTEEHKDLLSLLHCFHPKQGDRFRLEPGLIHGTKGSLLLFEIQQPSDYTFRIYDFGNNRPLHLEEAKQVIKKRSVQKENWNTPLTTDFFSLSVWNAHEIKHYEVKKPYEILTYFGPPAFLSGSCGSFDITWGSSLLFWSESLVSFEATSASLSSEASGLDKAALTFSDLPLMNLNEARFFISSE